MHQRLLILATILLGVVAPTAAGPDKVAFPSSYKTHQRYPTVDRPDNKTVRDIYISPERAKTANAGEPLPRGTVITMEVYKAQVDEQGERMKDANACLIKEELTGIFVMEKRTGWGAEYGDALRNGEWKYARFTPTASPHRMSTRGHAFSTISPWSGQVSR